MSARLLPCCPVGALLVLSVGCASTPPPPPRLPAAPVPQQAFAWRTLRAEHKVIVEYEKNGEKKIRQLRGLLMVARPGQFRARALGPADITLIDVIGMGGQCAIVQALRRPTADLIRKLCDGLRSAYRLTPPPKAPPEVRYADWRTVNGHPLPYTVSIEGRGFRVTMYAVEQAVDVELPEEAFRAEDLRSHLIAIPGAPQVFACALANSGTRY